jgi:hypothetical protein
MSIELRSKDRDVSTRCWISRLPKEVLAPIFHVLLEDGYANLAKCLQVSRAWQVRHICGLMCCIGAQSHVQDIAEPVLYSQVKVYDEDDLRTLKAAFNKREYLGKYIRTVDTDDSNFGTLGEITAVTHALVVVLLMAPNLKYIHIGNHLALGVMPILSHTCVASLRELQLGFHNAPDYLFEVLTHVGQFSALEVLILLHERSGDVVLTSPLGEDRLPWVLPRLRVLKVVSNSRWPITEFLSRCEFSSLHTLDFQTSIINKDTQALENFFARVPAQKIILRTQPMYWQTAVSSLHSASSLELILPSSLDIIGHLPPNIQTLVIPLPIHKKDALEDIYSSLDILLGRESHVRDVHLSHFFHHSFTWVPKRFSTADSRTEWYQLADRSRADLVLYSTMLAKRGTQLRDTAGKTMLDYYM